MPITINFCIMHLYYIASYLGTKPSCFQVIAFTSSEAERYLIDYLNREKIPYDRIGMAFYQNDYDPGLFDTDFVSPISNEVYYYG